MFRQPVGQVHVSSQYPVKARALLIEIDDGITDMEPLELTSAHDPGTGLEDETNSHMANAFSTSRDRDDAHQRRCSVVEISRNLQGGLENGNNCDEEPMPKRQPGKSQF